MKENLRKKKKTNLIKKKMIQLKNYHSKKIPEALQSIRNGAWKALNRISQREERDLTKFSTRSLEKSLVSIIKWD